MLKEIINAFEPFGKQEIQDKEYFINLIDKNYNIIFRTNEHVHFSSSAFIVNKERTKMLAVWHNIFKGWIYPGGHADGNYLLREVSEKEVEEETGLVVTPIVFTPFGIQALPVAGHYKNEKYVSAHTHLDVVYLFEADESQPLKLNKEETSGVKWFSLDESYGPDFVDFIRPIHKKLVDKLRENNY